MKESLSMIRIDMYTTILTLYRNGTSIRQIAKITSAHRSTVQKIIKKYEEQKVTEPTPYRRPSEVEEWHQDITELLSQKLSAVRMHEMLCQKGFSSSYSTLTHYIRKHKIKTQTSIRLHTDPGEEAQVDFGYIGKQYDKDNKLRKAYVFNMRLGYSRYDYYEVVFDQKIETWIRCHINAFNYFGATPKIIKLDNLKSGVTKVDVYEPVYHKEYKRCADHYNVMLEACRPYQPQEKGKVESGIKYIKNNFFAGRTFKDNSDMQKQLDYWLVNANKRTHGTTKEQPKIIFDTVEKDAMQQLPASDYELSSWHKRKVAKDCHITLDNNYYSVPSKYVGEDVEISLEYRLVKIYNDQNELVATHARSSGKGIFTTNANHYDQYKRLCPGFEEHDNHYQNEMKKIGENGILLLSEIKKSHEKQWHRPIKGIVSLRKLYSDDVIDAACRRALHFGAHSYLVVKKIIENNGYHLPLNERGDYAEYH